MYALSHTKLPIVCLNVTGPSSKHAPTHTGVFDQRQRTSPRGGTRGSSRAPVLIARPGRTACTKCAAAAQRTSYATDPHPRVEQGAGFHGQAWPHSVHEVHRCGAALVIRLQQLRVALLGQKLIPCAVVRQNLLTLKIETSLVDDRGQALQAAELQVTGSSHG